MYIIVKAKTKALNVGLLITREKKSIKLIIPIFIYFNPKIYNITIPQSVILIGVGVFGGCKNLNRIDVDINNNNYSSNNGILFNKDYTKLLQCPMNINTNEIIIDEGIRELNRQSLIEGNSLIFTISKNTSEDENRFKRCVKQYSNSKRIHLIK